MSAIAKRPPTIVKSLCCASTVPQYLFRQSRTTVAPRSGRYAEPRSAVASGRIVGVRGLLVELLAQVGGLVGPARRGALLGLRGGVLRTLALGQLTPQLLDPQRLGRRVVVAHLRHDGEASPSAFGLPYHGLTAHCGCGGRSRATARHEVCDPPACSCCAVASRSSRQPC